MLTHKLIAQYKSWCGCEVRNCGPFAHFPFTTALLKKKKHILSHKRHVSDTYQCEERYLPPLIFVKRRFLQELQSNMPSLIPLSVEVRSGSAAVMDLSSPLRLMLFLFVSPNIICLHGYSPAGYISTSAFYCKND